MIDLQYVIFGVNLTGVLFYLSTIWMVVLGKRKWMLGCFTSGSLLMSVGLVIALGTIPFEDAVLPYIMCAFTWMVFGAIILSTNEFSSNFSTESDIRNLLDGGINLEEGTDLVGFWQCWDKTLRYDGGKFKYALIEIYEVNTFLNTIRGEQHYGYRYLTESVESAEEIQEYYNKFKGTAIKLD